MAQKSKKEYITQIALPLFLENGFKGTSIDLVVKESGVSKPTVYNHFPDKAALIQAVIQRWCEHNHPDLNAIANLELFEKTIQNKWLTSDAVKLYALVIGEGRRFADAKKIFWKLFDDRWRKALIKSAEATDLADQYKLEQSMDQLLINRLKNL